MKKLILIAVFCTCGLMSQNLYAQISVHINISNQPVWGPVGYDYVEYYYLPDIDAYYYVPSHMFICLENGRWLSRPYLPGRYRDFDLYRARKIVVNEPRPYMRNNYYRSRYANARGYSRPMMIRDSHDSRYFVIKDHPLHAQWRGNSYNRGNMNSRDNRAMNMNRGQEKKMMRNQGRNEERRNGRENR